MELYGRTERIGRSRKRREIGFSLPLCCNDSKLCFSLHVAKRASSRCARRRSKPPSLLFLVMIFCLTPIKTSRFQKLPGSLNLSTKSRYVCILSVSGKYTSTSHLRYPFIVWKGMERGTRFQTTKNSSSWTAPGEWTCRPYWRSWRRNSCMCSD